MYMPILKLSLLLFTNLHFNHFERSGSRGTGSVQAAASQVIGDDDVSDGVEHHLDVPCICGTGHVTVDLFIGWAVLALKLCLDVSSCIIISVGACGEGQVREDRRRKEEKGRVKKVKERRERTRDEIPVSCQESSEAI